MSARNSMDVNDSPTKHQSRRLSVSTPTQNSIEAGVSSIQRRTSIGRLHVLVKSRRSISTIPIFLGFALPDCYDLSHRRLPIQHGRFGKSVDTVRFDFHGIELGRGIGFVHLLPPESAGRSLPRMLRQG